MVAIFSFVRLQFFYPSTPFNCPSSKHACRFFCMQTNQIEQVGRNPIGRVQPFFLIARASAQTKRPTSHDMSCYAMTSLIQWDGLTQNRSTTLERFVHASLGAMPCFFLLWTKQAYKKTEPIHASAAHRLFLSSLPFTILSSSFVLSNLFRVAVPLRELR